MGSLNAEPLLSLEALADGALAEAGAVLQGAPSCFTRQTGEAHWHVLQRARAMRRPRSEAAHFRRCQYPTCA